MENLTLPRETDTNTNYIVIVFHKPFGDGTSVCEIGLCGLNDEGLINTETPLHKMYRVVKTCNDIKNGGNIHFQCPYPEQADEFADFVQGVRTAMKNHPVDNVEVIAEVVWKMYDYYLKTQEVVSVN